MKKGKTFRPDRVLSYFKAEWLPLAFVTLSGLVYNIGLLATPWFEGRLAQCLADILGGSETAAKMAMLVLAYIVVTLAVQAARFIKRFYVRRFANNINRRMKGILYANLVRQSRAALEKEGAGELMTKAISDVDDCVEGMRKFTTEIFDTGVALVGYAVMLLVYDWRLALLSLLFTPFSYMCAAWMKKPVQRAGAAYKKAASALSAATLDRARNAVTYRIYGCEDARVEKYEEALNTYEKTAVRNNVWQSALPPLYLAASEAGVLFILWFGAKNVLGSGWSTWDIAAFTTFLSCFTKLVVKSSKVAKLFNSVQKAEVSWKRIKPLMKQPEQLEALHIPAAQDVTLENLSFAYGEGPIFSGLSLTGADTEVVLTAMDQLIRGMSTAFLTSIVGVCGSLLFNLLNNRATDKCQKAIDRFCEVFSLYAMPKPVSEDTAMLALQQEQTAYIRQAVEDMSQKMAVQMEQSIMRAMLPVQRSMDNFILAATQAQVEGVDRIAQVFVQRMNVALGNEFDHLRQVLADTGAEQQKTQQELRAATEAIGQMTQDVVNMHQLSQGVLEHFRAYVADMDASRAQVDDTNRKTIELLEAMGKTSGQQALYLAKLQEYQAALTAASQQYTAWTDRFLASAQEQTRITGKEMDRVVGEMHEGSRTLSGAYEQFTKQTQENLARTTALFDESISSSIHQLNETLDSMRDMTRGMPQLLSQSRDRYAEQVDQFVTALVRLQKAMDKLSQTMDGKE